MNWRTFAVVPLLASIGLGVAFLTTRPLEAQEDASVARTREQIRMLDDLYKTAVVLITEHYVESTSSLSAATASKALFAAMAEKGWHEVRLVGLTDDLVNPDNAPADDFERAAAEKLLAGEAFYEEVVTSDGSRSLRYATPVPVVMEKCVMCHPSWEGNTGNIGTLSYTVPLIN